MGSFTRRSGTGSTRGEGGKLAGQTTPLLGSNPRRRDRLQSVQPRRKLGRVTGRVRMINQTAHLNASLQNSRGPRQGANDNQQNVAKNFLLGFSRAGSRQSGGLETTSRVARRRGDAGAVLPCLCGTVLLSYTPSPQSVRTGEGVGVGPLNVWNLTMNNYVIVFPMVL